MVKKIKDGYEDAPMLTDAEREQLLKKLEPPPVSDQEAREIEKAWIEKAWLEEAKSADRAIEEGREKAIPAEEVMRELWELVSK
jgi:hypothetical protein